MCHRSFIYSFKFHQQNYYQLYQLLHLTLYAKCQREHRKSTVNFINEIRDTTSKIQKPIYLTRDEIEKRVKMNIPTAHKDKYLDLLYKFRSVISKDKSDLGMAKNFFHRIVLKDDAPVYRKQYHA